MFMEIYKKFSVVWVVFPFLSHSSNTAWSTSFCTLGSGSFEAWILETLEFQLSVVSLHKARLFLIVSQSGLSVLWRHFSCYSNRWTTTCCHLHRFFGFTFRPLCVAERMPQGKLEILVLIFRFETKNPKLYAVWVQLCCENVLCRFLSFHHLDRWLTKFKRGLNHGIYKFQLVFCNKACYGKT